MKLLKSLIALLLFGREFLFATSFDQSVVTPPQTNLPKIELNLGSLTLEVLLATTFEQRAIGLMHRTSLGVNEGMLFVFDFPQQVAFWMKNTAVPLSIAYINPSGMILEIYDMNPFSEKLVPSTFHSILYALEMPQGWFERNGIQLGTKLKGLPPVLIKTNHEL